MAKPTAKVTVNVINQAQSTSLPTLGIVYVAGPTAKGIPNNPDDLITNVAQFERLYGGIIQGNDFPLICEQAIQAGASLRVCKVVDNVAAPASTPTIVVGTANAFKFTSKGYGTYYNSALGNFLVDLDTPSNGDTAGGYFNLIIQDIGSGITELYENLKFVKGTVAASTYLKDVADTSRLVNVTYFDSSAASGVVVPLAAIATTGGLDGGVVDAVDYTGVQANKTGFYAFDNYNDSFMVSAPSEDEVTCTGIYNAGQAYASLRKDMVYLQHISNTKNTASAITTELQGLTDTKFAALIGGGVKVVDTINGGMKSMSEMGMVLGAIASSHRNFGPWYSPTGYTRGLLLAAAGVVNNFGSPAALADRDLIAQDGGNMVVNKAGTIMLWDAYSQALANSPEKFLSIVWLELYMVSVLKPLLEFHLGSPNLWTTWKTMYYQAKPFLDSLVQQEALYEYQWDGDQFVTSLDDLQINNATDVGQGKYKIQLQMKAVVPMVDITLNIVLTEASVEFS